MIRDHLFREFAADETDNPERVSSLDSANTQNDTFPLRPISASTERTYAIGDGATAQPERSRPDNALALSTSSPKNEDEVKFFLDSTYREAQRGQEERLTAALTGEGWNAAILSRMPKKDQVRARLLAHDRMSSVLDTLTAQGYAAEPTAQMLFDTLRALFPEPAQRSLPDTLFGEAVELTLREELSYDVAELVERSEVERWYNRVVLTKLLEVNEEGDESMNAYLLSTVSWVVLLFVPMLAFGYWVLYRRRLPYFAQHLNLAALLLAVGLILATIGLLTAAAFNESGWIIKVLAVSFYVYVLLTEIRVLQVAWWKVMLKHTVLGVYSFFAFTLALVLWILLAVLVK